MYITINQLIEKLIEIRKIHNENMSIYNDKIEYLKNIEVGTNYDRKTVMLIFDK